MAKPGPRPKPTALKLIDGTKPSRVNTQEPQPPPPDGVPEPPDYLSECARGYWRDLIPLLMDSRVMTAADLKGFAVLCEAFDMHERAARILNGEGVEIVSQGERGKVRHVALNVLKDAAYTIRAWSSEFGLTPASRSSIKVPERADSSERAHLLS